VCVHVLLIYLFFVFLHLQYTLYLYNIHTHYIYGKVAISMSGDFTSDSIEELAARYWSNIPPPPPQPSTDIKHFFSKHDKEMSHVDMTVSDTTSETTSDVVAASNAAEIASTSLVQVMKETKGFKWSSKQEALGDELQLKWWLSPFREPEAGENTHSEVL
jgi:hypothetical protein